MQIALMIHACEQYPMVYLDCLRAIIHITNFSSRSLSAMKFNAAHVECHVDRQASVVNWLRSLLTNAKSDDAVVEFLTRMAQSFGCERAARGFVTGKIVKICAVSHHHYGLKDAALPEIAAATEESILQDAAFANPDCVSDFPHIVRPTRSWRDPMACQAC